MRVKKLIVKNIGLLEDINLALDKPLILFYGEIRQGKTTILNAVRWCFGGPFPGDIIRHGQTEAEITLILDEGSVTRTFYISRDGKTTKARPIVFIRDGRPVLNPVEEIKKLLNPFLIDQDHFRNMGETERKRYFVDLFAGDVASLDTEADKLSGEASELRAKISGYGEISTEVVAAPDIFAIESEEAAIRAKHSATQAQAKAEIEAAMAAHNAERVKVEKANWVLQAAYEAGCANVNALNTSAFLANKNRGLGEDKRRKIIAEIETISTTILELDEKREVLRKQGVELGEWLASNPEQNEALPKPPAPTLSPLPELPNVAALQAVVTSAPDLSAVQAKRVAAAEQKVRHEVSVANQARAEKKRLDQALLASKEVRQRAIQTEKIARLQKATAVIEGLSFDAGGNFTFEGVQAGMLSTSQVMKLSERLSALYPEGFGLDLIDRAESLGKSIFGFVERAKAEDKTILATIVGERPADVPEEVGVFVVEAGRLKI